MKSTILLILILGSTTVFGQTECDTNLIKKVYDKITGQNSLQSEIMWCATGSDTAFWILIKTLRPDDKILGDGIGIFFTIEPSLCVGHDGSIQILFTDGERLTIRTDEYNCRGEFTIGFHQFYSNDKYPQSSFQKLFDKQIGSIRFNGVSRSYDFDYSLEQATRFNKIFKCFGTDFYLHEKEVPEKKKKGKSKQ